MAGEIFLFIWRQNVTLFANFCSPHGPAQRKPCSPAEHMESRADPRIFNLRACARCRVRCAGDIEQRSFTRIHSRHEGEAARADGPQYAERTRAKPSTSPLDQGPDRSGARRDAGHSNITTFRGVFRTSVSAFYLFSAWAGDALTPIGAHRPPQCPFFRCCV